MISDTPHQTLPIRFTGSGSEYFRIWIVNLLLIIVTLSLYLPFAKARRLRYFYGNTLVGEHALAFHGDPWKMLRGHVLALVLFGSYAMAGKVSPLSAFVAFVILALIWPALWRSAMRFRSAATSWRGLRFGFVGATRGAYLALAPFAIGAVLMLLAPVVGAGPAGANGQPTLTVVGGLLSAGGLLVALCCAPWAFARMKRYQHNHYVWANQQTQLATRTRTIYWLALKIVLLALLPFLLFGVAVGMTAMGTPRAEHIVLIGLAFVVLYAAMLLIVYPYAVTRTQNLLWSQTASEGLQFTSRLPLGAMLRVNAINLLLTILTLGFYRPFAAVHMARLRLQAVSVAVSGNLDDWVSQHVPRSHEAAGDAAGDFFGIDVGL